ncbi:MAG: glycosyltransferase family 2 protein [Burkholderiales bacterium]|nr:glycosyltransferase family 2 protein [Burkholderiales bacterium]
MPEALSLPITVLLAVRNEAVNLPRCLAALGPAQKIYVIDSHSADETANVAKNAGAEVIQFDYRGGYPKKRQWALDHLPIDTPWIFFLDADEVVPEELWQEIASAIGAPHRQDAYLIKKGFHFLGRRFRFGGFSHSAVLLLRAGKGRFERLFDDSRKELDMEVHERVIVDGPVGRLNTPLIHEDFKGLEAYIDRHNKYSSWEARVRHQYLTKGIYGQMTIKPNLFGNSQERRRFIKSLVVRLPGEHWLWFLYHYVIRLGFLEGRPGLIASRIRASYIAQVRAKLYELRLRR